VIASLSFAVVASTALLAEVDQTAIDQIMTRAWEALCIDHNSQDGERADDTDTLDILEKPCKSILGGELLEALLILFLGYLVETDSSIKMSQDEWCFAS